MAWRRPVGPQDLAGDEPTGILASTQLDPVAKVMAQLLLDTQIAVSSELFTELV